MRDSGRRRRGVALILTLALLLLVHMLALAMWGRVRGAERRLAAERRRQLRVEALEYAFALLESRVRERLVNSAPPRPGELCAGADGPGVVVAFGYPLVGQSGSDQRPPPAMPPGTLPAMPPAVPHGTPLATSPATPLATLHVRGRVLPDAAESVWTVDRDPDDGRPRSVTRTQLELAHCTLAELRAAVEAHVAVLRGSPESRAALAVAAVAALDTLRRGQSLPEDLDALTAQLRAALPESASSQRLVDLLDPLPRLRRTNAAPGRTGGRDRGSVASSGPVLAARLSGRLVLEAEVTDEGRGVWRARRSIDLLERARWARQSDAWNGTVAQPCGVGTGARVVVGPELSGVAGWETRLSSPVNTPVELRAARWHAVPGGFMTTVSGGVYVCWPGEEGGAARVTGPWQAGTSDPAVTPMVATCPLPTTGIPEGARVVARFRRGDGSTSLIAAATRLWTLDLVRRAAAHPDLAGHVLLRPLPAARAARWQAPLREHLRAQLADGSWLEGEGTVNAVGSVLRGADLADLLVDGVYLSPLRRESLRWSGDGDEALLPAARAGRGSLLVKPERAAQGAPDPARERVLLTVSQQFQVTLVASAQWVASQHPDVDSASDVRAVQVGGPARRSGVLRSVIGRRPRDGVWFHRRQVLLFDEPWRVTVTVGDPPVVLPALVIEGAGLGVSEAEAVAAESAGAGEWQRLEFGWRSGADAFIATRSGGGWSSAPTRAAVTGDVSVFVLEPLEWTVELGASAGARVLQGTVTDLRLADGVGSQEATNERVFPAVTEAPDLLWRPDSLLPAGSRLRRVAARGVFPDGTALRWRVTPLVEAAAAAEAAAESRAPELLEGRGRWLAPGWPTLPAPTRLELALWLEPDATGRRAPLVESVEVEWIPAPRITPAPIPQRVGQ